MATIINKNQKTALAMGDHVGSWFSTYMHLDNYDIQKFGTKFNVLCVKLDPHNLSQNGNWVFFKCKRHVI